MIPRRKKRRKNGQTKVAKRGNKKNGLVPTTSARAPLTALNYTEHYGKH